MAQELFVLLQSHAFLKSAVRDYGQRMPIQELQRLKARESDAFHQILTYCSDDPRVTLTQVRFLVACLADYLPDTPEGEMIADAARRASERLRCFARQDLHVKPSPNPADYRLLDSLTDRVGIFDTDYRYRFTNAANLEFHDSTPGEFIDRPSSDVTGETFFAAINKPRFDACLAGETVQCYAHNPSRHKSKLFWATYSPIRDGDGVIRSVLMVSREVTELDIPKNLIAQF